MDVGRCITHKLCQLSYAKAPEIYFEDENFVNLKDQIYRK